MHDRVVVERERENRETEKNAARDILLPHSDLITFKFSFIFGPPRLNTRFSLSSSLKHGSVSGAQSSISFFFLPNYWVM